MSGDFEELRETIKDYYGTAMTSGLPMAIIELAEVENASDDELIEIAKRIGLEVE